MSHSYVDYKSALDRFSLQTLSDRRQLHMQKFAVRRVNDDFNKLMFPFNINRSSETFHVNFARTSQYLQSTIPQCTAVSEDTKFNI